MLDWFDITGQKILKAEPVSGDMNIMLDWFDNTGQQILEAEPVSGI